MYLKVVASHLFFCCCYFFKCTSFKLFFCPLNLTYKHDNLLKNSMLVEAHEIQQLGH